MEGRGKLNRGNEENGTICVCPDVPRPEIAWMAKHRFPHDESLAAKKEIVVEDIQRHL
jgi:hypothetical protein